MEQDFCHSPFIRVNRVSTQQKIIIYYYFNYLFYLPIATSALACNKIVSFGDSLSDNGPGDGYGFGVWINGYVWLDYLADEMGAGRC